MGLTNEIAITRMRSLDNNVNVGNAWPCLTMLDDGWLGLWGNTDAFMKSPQTNIE